MTQTQFVIRNIENLITGLFTVIYPKADQHRTIILRYADSSFFNWEKPGTMLIGYLIGPDNSNDYRYVGRIQNGKVQFFLKFAQSVEPIKLQLMARAIEIALDWEKAEDLKAENNAYALKSNNCVRCHKPLTNGTTLSQLKETMGLGPICFQKVFES